MINSNDYIHQLPISIKRVIIPLDYKYASTGDLIVKTGDVVKKNSILTKTLPFDHYGISLHSPINGIVKNISYYPVLNATNNTLDERKLVKCIEITNTQPLEINTGKEKEKEHNIEINRSNLLSTLSHNGIIGLGGAGFPSAKKLATQKIKLLLINGVECESPINVDNVLMQNKYSAIIDGINLLIKILNPEQTILAIKETMIDSVTCIKSELEIQNNKNINLNLIPDKYPNGYSKTLINLISKVTLGNNQHSSENGIICLNVATVYSIWNAIINQQPLIERLVTITGDINEPGTYLLPIGTTLNCILVSCGIDLNLIHQNKKSLKIKIGGDFMGYEIFNSQLNHIKDSETYLKQVSIDQTIQAIKIEYQDIAKPKALIINKIIDAFTSKDAQVDCINCGFCEPVCPVQLMPQKLYWFSKKYKNANNTEILNEYKITQCIECGLCDTVCPSNIPLSTKFKHIKSELKYEQHKQQQAKLSEARNNLREQRHHLKTVNKSKISLSRGKSAKKNLLQAALKRAQNKKDVNINQEKTTD